MLDRDRRCGRARAGGLQGRRQGQGRPVEGLPGRARGAADGPDAAGPVPERRGRHLHGGDEGRAVDDRLGVPGGDIGDAHDAYVSAVSGAAGYSVTKEEQDAADAEVNFEGAGQSGQVKLLQTCKTRTTVTITIRPA